MFATMLASAPAPAGAIDKTFWGGDCRFKSDIFEWPGRAETRTEDLNGGCSWLDADLKYKAISNGNEVVRTKWCPGEYTDYYTCVEYAPHYQSRSRVKDSSYSTRYTTGWWG